ncbi:BTB/POZ domain-containing protein At5g48130 isoform X1 [Cryptomeria japonica]|uniref:BTB/POZ domain-containing protein At5g48130 isoform X1 n=2 Tax=Cryptomeria japonica TaxID=3369 RepID=UPI0025AC7869|nr:BTB/POZ domain-containing protein At5g48130 isoform X1 [Cryptomeria japonica]
MVPGERRRWKDLHGNTSEIGRADTIYEGYEGDNAMMLKSTPLSEEDRNVVMVMNAAYKGEDNMQKKSSGHIGSSSSSPGSALQHNIRAWCEATGLPTSVIVHVEDSSFKLHKYPLVSKSGFLKRNLSNASEITLDIQLEVFELVANFCYGSTILMDPFNVAALRCAAEVLEMTEEYARGNLCERSDVYFTQVVLQSWEDTLIVLKKCENLLPLAEEIHIVSRCIDSLAYIACIEVLDPQQRNVKLTQSQFLSNVSASSRQMTNNDWWVKDLLTMSMELFERIIVSMQEQGMEEMMISRVIVQYGTKWILGDKRQQGSNGIAEKQKRNGNLNGLLDCVTRLLPMEGHSEPLDFLFSLLRVCLSCNLNIEYKDHLEARIATQLEYATVDMFFLPTNSVTCTGFNKELESMKQIVSIFMYQQSITMDHSRIQRTSSNLSGFETVATVASLWDEYLAQIAYEKNLNPSKFSELIGVLPPSARSSHDLLYKAIHTYLTAHSQLSHEERLSVCKYLKVQKLSQEACIHAVQNELMPLRLIVQAMFLQQVQTRSIWPNSDIVQLERNDNIDPLAFLQRSSIPSGNLLSDAITSRTGEDEEGLPLGVCLKRDAAFRQAANLKSDYEATSLRLRNLEEELGTMKKNLEDNKKQSDKDRSIQSSRKSESFRVISMSKPVDTGCNAFTTRSKPNWLSQRKSNANFVQKLWKNLRRFSFRKGKTDQNIEIQEIDSDSDSPPDLREAKDTIAEVNQNKGNPPDKAVLQLHHLHRRNFSYS